MKSTNFINTWTHPYKSHVNILLFGPTGIGKSSIINMLYSLVSDNVEMVASARIGDKDHVTVEYGKYVLTDKIILWDTFGWVQDLNYKGEEFSNILTGSVRNNTKMDKFIAQRVPTLENEIDAVIFVVDDAAPEIPKDIKAMKVYYDIAKSMNKTICVAVTKLDQSDEKIANETDINKLRNHFRNSKVLKAIRSLLFESWQDQTLKIFPVLNYIAGEHLRKDPAKESTAETLLRDLLGSISKPVKIELFDYFVDETVCEALYKQK